MTAHLRLVPPLHGISTPESEDEQAHMRVMARAGRFIGSRGGRLEVAVVDADGVEVDTDPEATTCPEFSVAGDG